MPSTLKQGTSLPNHAETSIIIPVESGILQAVRFSEYAYVTTPASCYAIIRLVSSETPTPIPIVTLCSGYVGGAVEFGWTGNISLEPTFAVQAIFVAFGQRPYNLSTLVHK